VKSLNLEAPGGRVEEGGLQTGNLNLATMMNMDEQEDRSKAQAWRALYKNKTMQEGNRDVTRADKKSERGSGGA